MEKVLILGSSGLLGRHIYEKLNKDKKIQLFHTGLKKRKIDFLNRGLVKKLICSISPSLIINSIGFTDIEKCEKNKKLAYKANYLIIKNLCDVIKSSKIKLIHISTDHLFNGIKETYYSESDIKNPLNTYSLTKSLSEDILFLKFIRLFNNF